MKHVLSVEERELGRRSALTSDAREKRRQTWARYRSEDKEAVRELRNRGLVPLAIGPALNMPDSTVARYLRELVSEGAIEPIPAYLTIAEGETA
jgi:Fic family protein